MMVAVVKAAVQKEVGTGRAGVGVILARLLVVLARLLVVLARVVGVVLARLLVVLASPQVRHGVGRVIRFHRRRSVNHRGILK